MTPYDSPHIPRLSDSRVELDAGQSAQASGEKKEITHADKGTTKQGTDADPPRRTAYVRSFLAGCCGFRVVCVVSRCHFLKVVVEE